VFADPAHVLHALLHALHPEDPAGSYWPLKQRQEGFVESDDETNPHELEVGVDDVVWNKRVKFLKPIENEFVPLTYIDWTLTVSVEEL